MNRLSLALAFLTLAPATATAAAQTLSKQAAPLPHVTLSAPGYAARAEVRRAVTTSENTMFFSPAQVRVVLDRAGQPKWKAQYATEMPPASVTVTPVQNWLTLHKNADLQAMVRGEVEKLRAINAGRVQPAALQGRDFGAGKLPYLPLVNAAQAVTGSAARLNTPQLQGVRYLAVYAQDTSDFPRSAVFYTYQGLSRDGKYVVSVQLPHAPRSFPATSGPLKGDLGTSFRQTRAKLDAENRNLAALDRLVQSIRIR